MSFSTVSINVQNVYLMVHRFGIMSYIQFGIHCEQIMSIFLWDILLILICVQYSTIFLYWAFRSFPTCTIKTLLNILL